MPSLRQIRGRLRSIQNSKQIMRAMQLVSGSKLKRSQGRLGQSREVAAFLDELLQRVLAARASGSRRKTAVPEHPLCRAQEGRPSALVVVTSDAGLCGSYNANLIQLADAHLRRESARTTQLVFIGKKGYRYFTKRGWQAAEAHLDLAGRPNPAKAAEIGRALMQRMLSGSVGSVSVLYSRFVSATVYRPTIEPWLPIRLKTQDSSPKTQVEYLFEPTPQRVFEDLLPRWAVARFQLMLLEAFTSEHSARMIAMKNATDNAQELLDALTTQRNKIRQAAITKELSEIVGTAEALK
jgi:F-type H+-transporting ATPase subunit gamma